MSLLIGIEVRSSSIRRLGYIASHQRLYVEFRNTRTIWMYEKLCADSFKEFKRADSHGKFFRQHIVKQHTAEKQSGLRWGKIIEAAEAIEIDNPELVAALKRNPLAIGF